MTQVQIACVAESHHSESTANIIFYPRPRQPGTIGDTADDYVLRCTLFNLLLGRVATT